MAQNRKPPAYQEYAASVIASAEYRMLTLAARGLLYSLKLECWENRQVPREPTALSRFLGVPEEELRSTLPQIMFYFRIQGRDGKWFIDHSKHFVQLLEFERLFDPKFEDQARTCL